MEINHKILNVYKQTRQEIFNSIDHNPKRLETETFEEYKLRRQLSNRIIKQYYLKGVRVPLLQE